MSIRSERHLSDAEKLDWLRLIRSDNVGPATFQDLMKHYTSASSALEALPDLARRAGRRIRVCPVDIAEREFAAIESHGGRLIALDEPSYPAWLRQIEHPPPLITFRGDPGILGRSMVAIVGARNASVSGRKLAATIASELSSRGFAIASGLARGIDATAQEAAIEGGTVGVLAGGLDRIYPPEHVPLAERIIAAGGLLSEMPMGHEPRARDFPRRNRLISGLSVGVLVVEAAERSGSLISARYAGEQGRLLFAVPGSPLDPRAAGTNRLLKQGAIVTTSASDIVSAIEPMLTSPLPPLPLFAGQETMPAPAENPQDARGKVLEAMGPAPIQIDEIIRFTGLKPSEIQLVLIELDLAGRIERHPGERVSLI